MTSQCMLTITVVYLGWSDRNYLSWVLLVKWYQLEVNRNHILGIEVILFSVFGRGEYLMGQAFSLNRKTVDKYSLCVLYCICSIHPTLIYWPVNLNSRYRSFRSFAFKFIKFDVAVFGKATPVWCYFRWKTFCKISKIGKFSAFGSITMTDIIVSSVV